MAGGRVTLGLMLLVSALLRSAHARADDSTWTLHWRAPPGCPSSAMVWETVTTWLELSSEGADPRGVVVVARVTQQGREFVLDLHLSTPSGEARERHTSQRCETLAEVLALKVALAADPSAWFDELKAREQAASGVGIGLRLAAGPAFGSLPEVAPVLSLTSTLRFRTFAFELGVSHGFSEQMGFWTANLRVCALPEIGPVELPLCAGADLGALHADGFSSAPAAESSQLYAALVLGPAMRLRIAGGFFGWLGADALVPVLRPVFGVVDGAEPRWRPAAVGARVQLGAELHFD